MRTASGFRRRAGLCTVGVSLLSMCVFSAHARPPLPAASEHAAVSGQGAASPQPLQRRPALVPQMPSYLSLAPALFHYEDVAARAFRTGAAASEPVSDTRLSPIVQRTDERSDYVPNLGFRHYGFGFRQNVGLTTVGLEARTPLEDGELRVAMALDRGSIKVHPIAVDGRSGSSYNADGFSTQASWTHKSGVWLEAGWRDTSYAGDVATLYRGSNAARLHARGRTLSVGGGMPWAAHEGWSGLSRVRLVSQWLTVDDLVDADRMKVRWNGSRRTTVTFGERFQWDGGGWFTPYATLDATWSRGGEAVVKVGRRRFVSGQVGHGVQLAVGSSATLGKAVEVYAEGVRRQALGAYGFDGWGVNLGMRAAF